MSFVDNLALLVEEAQILQEFLALWQFDLDARNRKNSHTCIGHSGF